MGRERQCQGQIGIVELAVANAKPGNMDQRRRARGGGRGGGHRSGMRVDFLRPQNLRHIDRSILGDGERRVQAVQPQFLDVDGCRAGVQTIGGERFPGEERAVVVALPDPEILHRKSTDIPALAAADMVKVMPFPALPL